MTKPVQIHMLGRFEILVNGEPALTQLKNAVKTMNLVQYLLLRQNAVPHDELIDALWPESQSANPSSALRTMLHRFRALVDDSGITALKNCILTSQGTYQWNPSIPCDVDILMFEKLVKHAPNGSVPERLAIHQQILDLYVGPLLPATAQELWVMPRSVYYHDLYLSSILQMIELYKTQEDYGGILRVCRRAMEVEPYDERLHMELMLALTKAGKNHEALSQYYYATDLQYKQFGIPPSEELRTLYKMIMQADQQTENDIDAIQQAIEMEDNLGGAFVCEYEIFKDIYQLQRRMLERFSTTMFIALLTVRDPYHENFDPLVLDSIMREFLEIARHALRRGDTISRYSATQFVVLLPAVTYESGNLIMDRIKKAFHRTYIKSSAIVSYKLRPLNFTYQNQDLKSQPDARTAQLSRLK